MHVSEYDNFDREKFHAALKLPARIDDLPALSEKAEVPFDILNAFYRSTQDKLPYLSSLAGERIIKHYGCKHFSEFYDNVPARFTPSFAIGTDKNSTLYNGTIDPENRFRGAGN